MITVETVQTVFELPGTMYLILVQLRVEGTPKPLTPVFNVFTVSKFLFKKDDEYANRYMYLALYLYRLESEVRSLKEFV